MANKRPSVPEMLAGALMLAVCLPASAFIPRHDAATLPITHHALPPDIEGGKGKKILGQEDSAIVLRNLVKKIPVRNIFDPNIFDPNIRQRKEHGGRYEKNTEA
jgi:hypothetical protein